VYFPPWQFDSPTLEAVRSNCRETSETTVEAKSYAKLAAAIFALIALLQLVRALSGWEITINGAVVPVWPSWVACGVGAVLAWLGFTASRA
jgi:hypothetical protein